MPRALPYRRASGKPAYPRRAFPLRRWVLALLFLLAVVAIIFAIAGDQAPAVFQTAATAIFMLPIFAAAAMLGIALTGPFAKAALFDDSPSPDLFRLLVSTALGLGALALATLLMGSLHFIEPGHTFANSALRVPTGGDPWAPALILLVAAGVGFLPTRDFLKSFNKGPLRQRIAYPAEWLILLAAIPVAIMLIAAAYPPGTLWLSEGRGYDVLEYHLQLPREYAANNSLAPFAHNVYSYFPQNVEMLYLLAMQLAKFAMRDPLGPNSASAYLWGIYPAQFLHVGLMLLTACALALAPIRMSAGARIIALLTFLSIPWTIITGSLAYNEGGMLLFGTLALALSLRSTQHDGFRRPLLIGILLGLSVGCKLTAGLFFALPVAAILVFRALLTKSAPAANLGPPRRLLPPPLRAVTVAALTALLLYSPWAIRAAVYSGGNPVFPLASTILPKDNWTTAQAQRFTRGHLAQQDHHLVGLFDLPTRARALVRESVKNPQWSPAWASIYTWANEKTEDTWWNHIGILWLIVPPAVLLALLASIRRMRTAGLTGAFALLVVMGIQLLAWTFVTHLQSRFLLPLAIPLSLLIAIGSEGLGAGVGGLPIGVLRILIAAVVVVQTFCCIFLLLPEVDLFDGTVARAIHNPHPQPIGKLFERQINWAAALEDPASLLAASGREPVGKILLVGDADPLFLEGDIVYNTTFDDNPLADQLRLHGPAAAARWLKQQHINYVIVDWTEIARLKSTYGYDDAITPEAIEALTRFGIKPLPNPIPNAPASLLLTILQVAPTSAVTPATP